MLHRHPGALRLPRSGESRKYLEVFIWMLIGLVVYFAYGRRHSRVGQASQAVRTSR